jgi:hypothetical protein
VVCPNLIAGFVSTAPNQVWVADITRVQLLEDLSVDSFNIKRMKTRLADAGIEARESERIRM